MTLILCVSWCHHKLSWPTWFRLWLVVCSVPMHYRNTLRPRQNGHFADDVFKCIFLNENASIAIKISLKFVPKGPINNIPILVQIMAWCRPGDKPLSEPMMVSLLTHICVTRPHWVKQRWLIVNWTPGDKFQWNYNKSHATPINLQISS